MPSARSTSASPTPELRALSETATPGRLRALDLAARLADGRALDLGRRWDELGCLLEGGISVPRCGPTVGDHALFVDEDRAAWSFVTAEGAAAYAREIGAIDRAAFLGLYQVDDDGTAEGFVEEPTGAWPSRAEELFDKLTRLRDLYRAAAERRDAVLVRLLPVPE